MPNAVHNKNKKKGKKPQNFKQNEFKTAEEIQNENKIDTYYAEIKGACGNMRFSAELFPNCEKIIATLLRQLRKGPFTKAGDIVAVQKDPSCTGKDKYYIVAKYNQDQVQILKNRELLNKTVDDDNEDSNIILDNQVNTKNDIEISVDIDDI